MEILRDISENKFVMVLLNEEQYNHKLAEIIKGVDINHTGICYVCFSKPYKDVIEYLKGIGVNVEKFFFIDVLSSHYTKQKKVDNCIFIEESDRLTALRDAISKAVNEKNC